MVGPWFSYKVDYFTVEAPKLIIDCTKRMGKTQTRNEIGIRVALSLSLFNLVSSQESWDAELYMHDPVTAAKFNAYCLDGTKGGFYYRPATSVASQNRWKIHFSGGGWAFDVQSLVSRSKTLLGSSSFFTPWLSSFWPPEGAGFYGLMGVNDTTTADWNFVWLPYCAELLKRLIEQILLSLET